MSNSLLTVAIPTYNGGKNLLRAIESCSRINYDNYQILVVDNKSTDGSIEIAKKQFESNTKIKYHVNIENIGRVGNWNKCLDLGQGKYLVFLFSNEEIYYDSDIKGDIELLKTNDDVKVILKKILYKQGDKEFLSSTLTGVHKFEHKNFAKYHFEYLIDFVCFGIPQQLVFDLEFINQNNIRYDSRIPRTTDRVFNFEVINKSAGQFIFRDKINMVWNLDPSRFHYSAHNDFSNFDFYTVWQSEFLANSQILSSLGYSVADIYKIHLLLIARYDFNFFRGGKKTTPEDYTYKMFKEFLLANIDKQGLKVKYGSAFLTFIVRKLFLKFKFVNKEVILKQLYV